MNTAVISIARQKEAIERAQTVFARLPRNDAVFQQCVGNNETIHRLLANIFQINGLYKRKTSTMLLERFERYTSWMTNISDSINIAVQASAGIACPVWAPIKFVLIVSRNHARAAQQILDMVGLIKENLPRLELYAQANDDGGFQAGLLDLFTDIAEFAIHACRFFGRRSFVRLSRLAKHSFQDEHGDLISRIERRTKAIDGMAVALALKRHERLLRETQTMHHQDEAKRKRDQVRGWLRAPNIQEFQDGNLRLRTEATCEWILSHPEFQRWTKSKPADKFERVLVIHGPAGCGKSVLGSFLYDNLSNLSAGRDITLLFSFSAEDAERQTVDSLVRSLLSQLLGHDHTGELLPLLDNLQATGPPSTSALLDTLGKGIALLSLPVRSLIDGLDECFDSATLQRDDLVKWIREQVPMKAVLLGRSHAFTSLSNSIAKGPSIAIDYGLNGGDIQTFIDNEMMKWDSLSNQHVREKITRTLLDQADGMFLWVKLMIDHLKGFKYDEARITSLGDLPDGLDRSYSRILEGLALTLSEHKQQIVCAALSFAATSGRPLRMNEFRLAYALTTMPASDSASSGLDKFLLHIQPEELVELCGGLLIFIEGNFHLLHSSTREYLTRSEEHWRRTEHQSTWTFRIDTIQSHRTLGEICVRLLAEVDYSEVQCDQVHTLDAMKSQQPLLHYACLYLAYHLNRSGLSSVQLQDKVLNLLESDLCFFALEQLALHALGDFSAALQFEMWILAGFAFPQAYNYSEIFSLLSHRMEKEHTSRMSRFGEHDPRTVRWSRSQVAVSSILSDICTTERSPVVSDNLVDTSQEEHERAVSPTRESFDSSFETMAGTSSAPLRSTHMSGLRRARPLDASLSFERIRELLQNSHTGILGHQFEFAVTLLQHATITRLVIDPLEALWRIVQQKANTMPVTLLAALSTYYHAMGKNEKAYELGCRCLSRVGDGHLALRILVRHLMGFLAYNLDHYQEAVDHFEFSLPQEERWFKAVNPVTINGRVVMALCYERLEENEKAIEVLEEQLQRGSKSRIISMKQKLTVYDNLGSIQYACGRFDDARASRRGVLDLLQKALEDSDADLAYKSSLARLKIADVGSSPRQKRNIIRGIGAYLDHVSKSGSPEYIWGGWLPNLNGIFYRLLINMLTDECGALLKGKFGIQCRHDRCNAFLRAEYEILEDEEFSSQALEDFRDVLGFYKQVHKTERDAHSKDHGDKILERYYRARLYYHTDCFNDSAELLKNLLCSYNEHGLADTASAERNLSILWLTLTQVELRRYNDLDAAKAAQNAYSLISAVPSHFEDTAAISAVAQHSVKVTQGMVRQFGSHDWVRSQRQDTNEDNLKTEVNFAPEAFPPDSLAMTGESGDHVIEKPTTLGPGLLPLLLGKDDFDSYIPWRLCDQMRLSYRRGISDSLSIIYI